MFWAGVPKFSLLNGKKEAEVELWKQREIRLLYSHKRIKLPTRIKLYIFSMMSAENFESVWQYFAGAPPPISHNVAAKYFTEISFMYALSSSKAQIELESDGVMVWVCV